jgi:hypothetical protein
MTNPVDLPAVEAVIREMKDAGFTYSNYLMRGLHQTLMRNYNIKEDWCNALKACLKIYFLIEPIIIPPGLPYERLDTLMMICTFMDAALPSQVTNGMNGFPNNAQNISSHVWAHLRMKLARDTEKCFGVDSIAGKFELKAAVEGQQWLSGAVAKLGATWSYVPLTDPKEKGCLSRR